MRLFQKEKFNFRIPLSKDDVINIILHSKYDTSIKLQLDGDLCDYTFKFTPLDY